MGCDGGTIPKRDELVRTKKKPEQNSGVLHICIHLIHPQHGDKLRGFGGKQYYSYKMEELKSEYEKHKIAKNNGTIQMKDKTSELSFRWQFCSISQQPLRSPIVACGLGRLYNKDVVLEKLLEKSPLPETANHIKSLKDIKDLNFTINPAFTSGTEKGDGYVDRHTSPYICPMGGIEMNGKFKFCFSWICGCVFSERAMKQVNENVCVNCQKPYTMSDIVILNATDQDLEIMYERLAERLAERSIQTKALKKFKNKIVTEINKIKEKSYTFDNDNKVIDAGKQEYDDSTAISTDHMVQNKNNTTDKEKLKADVSDIKVNNNADIKVKNIADNKQQMSSNSDMPSLKHTSSKRSLTEIIDPAYKKSKQTYSVSKDPNSTEVYKSLFTTHKNAKTHSKAHWVTYNPFYN